MDHPIGILFVTVLIFRVLALPFLPPMMGQEHLEIAQFLLSGKGYVYEHETPSTYLAPFYIYFIYIFFKYLSLSWALILIKGIQILLSAMLAVILYRLGEWVFNRKVGLLTVLIYLFHPVFVALPSTLIVDAFLIPLLFALVYLSFHWAGRWSVKKALFFGLISGIALLTKWRSLAFILPIWGWWIWDHTQKKFTNPIPYPLFGIIILTTLLVIAPWSWRNYKLTGSLVLEHNFGYNFWIGNNPLANGYGKFTPIQYRFPRPPLLEQKIDRAPTDRERDRIFLNEGLNFWASDPWRGIRLLAKKILLFWWVDIKNPLTNHFLYLLPAIVVPISALLGLMTLRRPLTPLAFLLLAVLAIHYFSVMVTFYVARIRLSVEPVMFLLAAGFWCWLFSLIRSNSQKGKFRQCVTRNNNELET